MTGGLFYRFTAPLAVSALLAGCGTMAGGRPRGADATLKPGWARVGRAAVRALTAPEVWVPAAGAAALGVSGADRKISSWAIRRTPVSGSSAGARKASDRLITVSNLAFWSGVLAAPGGGRPGPWLAAKAKLAAGGLAANAAAFQSTLSLQVAVGRERPLHGTKNSFPSLHTAYAASQAASAYCNFRTVPMSPAGAALARGALDAIPAAMAWSRVEASRHFPSDTLAAMSLGSFLSFFVSDAFLGEAPLRVETEGGTARLTYRLAF